MILSTTLLALNVMSYGASSRMFSFIPVSLFLLHRYGSPFLGQLLLSALVCYGVFSTIFLMDMCRWNPVTDLFQPSFARIVAVCGLLLSLPRLLLTPFFSPLPCSDFLFILSFVSCALELHPITDIRKPSHPITQLSYYILYISASAYVGLGSLSLLFSHSDSALLFSIQSFAVAYCLYVAGCAYVDAFYQDRLATYSVKEKATHARRVGIIGAGASGLAYAKEMRDAGHTVQVFEADGAVGGVFATCYKDAVLTTSTIMTQFSAYQEEVLPPRFWTAREYVSYLERYVAHFHLSDLIHFNCKDIHVSVKKVDRPHPYESTLTYVDEEGVEQSQCFDHIVMCVGSNQKEADTPPFKNSDTFKGPIIHTNYFDSGEDFTGKRVAIIGCGESAADISLLVAEHAKQVYVSSRDFTNNGWFVPRYYFGHVNDLDTSWVHHALPKWFVRLHDYYTMYPIHIMGYIFRKPEWITWAKWTQSKNVSSLETYGVKNLSLALAVDHHGAEVVPEVDAFSASGIVLKNGRSIEVDAIILAVGFKTNFEGLVDAPFPVCHYPCVDHLFLNCLDPETHPHFPIIPGGFVRPHFGSIPPMSELQARYVSAMLAGAVPIPDKADMKQDIESWVAERLRVFGPHTSCRVPALTEQLPYTSRVAARFGCDPPLYYFALRAPRLWIWLMLGSLVSTRYRLVGPNASREDAIAKILQYNLSYMSLFHGLAMAILYPLQVWGIDTKVEKTIVGNHKWPAPFSSCPP